MNETEEGPYCGAGLVKFSKSYAEFHGYTSLTVCIIGSIANVINIIVLSRKEMISPTNWVLTALAVTDLIVLLDYIPYTCHTYLRPSSHSISQRYTWGWAHFIHVHSLLTQAAHTISIWLTVVLAIWRYIAVVHPQKNRDWCTIKSTCWAIVWGYVICPLLCIPLWFSFTVTPTNELLDSNGFLTKNESIGMNTTLYLVTMSDSDIVHPNFLKDLNFVIYSVLFKLTPSVALTFLIIRLVCALCETKRRRQNLTSSLNRKNAKNLEKEKQTDRTTRMLIGVLLLFLITEVPQGVLGLLTLICGEKFFKDCYQKLGDVMDMLAVTNSALNFTVYYIMSRQFRTAFKSAFNWGNYPAGKHLPLNEANNHTTTQITQV